MRFIKKKANDAPIVDTVFSVAASAKEMALKYGNDQVVNATIGSLYNEEGEIVAFDSVYKAYNKLPNAIKARYADEICGNADFREEVYAWVKGDSKLNLEHEVISTPGGTGAIALAMSNFLDENETVLLPEIGWPSYKLMAEVNHLKAATYKLFDDDHFNLGSFKEHCRKIMEKQEKLLVILNDPCHNPTGYSLSYEEWDEIIRFINELSDKGPCVLVNDIAYFDYCFDLKQSRDYLTLFNNFGDNVAVIVAFSCSKTLTAYGMRCGAAIVLAQSPETVAAIKNAFERTARATWSNVNNGMMESFVQVVSQHKKAFLKEKAEYIDLIKQRSNVFLSEAQSCDLSCYPYKEGFFITLKVLDDRLCKLYHKALLSNHIYTILVSKGIRIAICSVSVSKLEGLAFRIKEIFDKVREQMD